MFCFLFLMIKELHASDTTSPSKASLYGNEVDGGKLACLKSDGGINNLIAAKSDSSVGISWGGQGKAIGPSAQSETDGLGNTKAIVTTLGLKEEYAALLCTNYQIDSAGNSPCKQGLTCYKDWFLPSRKELDCLFEHKKELGGFASDFYWSSSEFSGYPEYSAWDKFFGDGEHPFASEDDFNRVRCVRVFNIVS